jgi:cell division protein FtsI/penicillin-binding protein 2
MLSGLILFHRRLLVLTACFVVCLIVLIVQVSQLTVVQGSTRLEKAKDRLHWSYFLPTWRGQILDRKGRVIAEDVASYDIAVEWDLITGDRARRLAIKDAKESVGIDVWETKSPEQRKQLTSHFLQARQGELDQFWSVIAQEGEVKKSELNLRLTQIQNEVEDTAKVVWARQEEVHKQRYGGNVPFEKQPIREQSEPHVILPRVSDEIAMNFSIVSKAYDNSITVQHSRGRAYPYRKQNVIIDRSTLPSPMRKFDAIEVNLEGVAELIVGDVRGDVWAEDIKKRPFRSEGIVDLGGYRSGDEVGNRGLESSLEDYLRGTRGMIVKHKSGDEIERVIPTGGNNVQVTLDIELQARVEAVLSQDLGLMKVQAWHRNAVLPEGTPLRGAVVVLDAKTSEVLAMASTPALRDEKDVEGYPWLNRAADGLYPPGSIIKPLVLVSAMAEGELNIGESIDCTGHYFEGVKNAARCWIFREKYNFATHGKLKPVEAIARSCNIFFYELGTRLGFDRLLDWLQRFGMSQPLSAKLTNTGATGTQGHLPDEQELESLRKRGALAFETVSISIGQGALTWSPLHAAAAYATLSRGGIWKTPTLVFGNEQEQVDLSLSDEGVSYALSGLSDSITKKYGTGSLLRYGGDNNEPTFNIGGVRLWGKTGTAEAPPYRLNSESPPVSGLDHSWFLLMAAPIDEKRPEVVVAVLVEHGGSGGRVAGPIANQILFALKSEGYLGSNK